MQIPALKTESWNVRVGSNLVILSVLYVSLFAGYPELWNLWSILSKIHSKRYPSDDCLWDGTGVHIFRTKPLTDGGSRRNVVPRSQFFPGHHLPAQKSKALRVLNPNLAFPVVMTLYLSSQEDRFESLFAWFVTLKYLDTWYVGRYLYSCPGPCKCSGRACWKLYLKIVCLKWIAMFSKP